MTFSYATIEAGLKRAGNRCECTRKTCPCSGHGIHIKLGSSRHTRRLPRCTKKFIRRNQYDAHHKTAVMSGGKSVLSNLEILCLCCHRNTRNLRRVERG